MTRPPNAVKAGFVLTSLNIESNVTKKIICQNVNPICFDINLALNLNPTTSILRQQHLRTGVVYVEDYKIP